MVATELTFSTLYLKGLLTARNGEQYAATARRASNESDVVVTYIVTARTGRTSRRKATGKQAATFVAYAWRSYLSADDVHAEALAENEPR